jgi:hypothetical protein
VPSLTTATRIAVAAAVVAAVAIPTAVTAAHASDTAPTVVKPVALTTAVNDQLVLGKADVVLTPVRPDYDQLQLGRTHIMKTAAFSDDPPTIVGIPYVPPPPAPKPKPKPKPKPVVRHEPKHAPRPVAKPRAAAPAPVSIPAGDVRALGQRLAAQRGWGAAQFACLDSLWNRESGWRVNASNPSGAYGIPQALPGSKMGPGWQSNPTVQITWGLNYIAGRYGTPCGAWAHSQSTGWY